ncbi:uncharacterized protein PG998_008846 [Apiospora kogelbergensis]|uniref:uncharacterized protein n=1 Tax=Apiospora kogelbergensis TaxID=1337665 RepID=UPI0031313613
MSEKGPQVNASLENIRRDLEVLRNAGALRPEQYASITAQLPAIAQQAQDPNHPANPKHSKHAEWAKGLAEKFGNAMVFGGGATLGSDCTSLLFSFTVSKPL